MIKTWSTPSTLASHSKLNTCGTKAGADSLSLFGLTFQGWDFPAPPSSPFPGVLELCFSALVPWGPGPGEPEEYSWAGRHVPVHMTARLQCLGVGGLHETLLFSLWAPRARGRKGQGQDQRRWRASWGALRYLILPWQLPNLRPHYCSSRWAFQGSPKLTLVLASQKAPLFPTIIWVSP